jgi:uncharacterized protein (DUF433 family)/predicted nuclease of predicted toxin-antitoxin system
MSDPAQTPPDPLITADPARMGGQPVFARTRIPVRILFEFLEDGAPLDEFLTSYPNVSREHAVAILELAKHAALDDNCIPVDLAPHIRGHDVSTVRANGWQELRDDELLDAMADGFDILVTVDKSIPFQQLIAGRPIAVLLLHAQSNRVNDLACLVPAMLRALNDISPGELREIG